MDKLISMTDFVLEQGLNPLQNDAQCWIKTHKYAELLKHPLTLGMFVPCDLDGNVLEDIETGENLKFHPLTPGDEATEYWIDYKIRKKEYQEAKERCMFDVFVIKGKASHLKEIWNQENYLFTYNASTEQFLTMGNTVENIVKYNLVLTESAKQKIFNT